MEKDLGQQQRYIVYGRGVLPLEDQIRRVDRIVLPTLHLVCEDQRISILETLVASGGVLPANELRNFATIIPTSSFFKFIQELEVARLIKTVARGNYVATETGIRVLDELIPMSQRLHDSMIERALDTIKGGFGLTEEQLRQIESIVRQSPQEKP